MWFHPRAVYRQHPPTPEYTEKKTAVKRVVGRARARHDSSTQERGTHRLNSSPGWKKRRAGEVAKRAHPTRRRPCATRNSVPAASVAFMLARTLMYGCFRGYRGMKEGYAIAGVVEGPRVRFSRGADSGSPVWVGGDSVAAGG